MDVRFLSVLGLLLATPAAAQEEVTWDNVKFTGIWQCHEEGLTLTKDFSHSKVREYKLLMQSNGAFEGDGTSVDGNGVKEGFRFLGKGEGTGTTPTSKGVEMKAIELRGDQQVPYRVFFDYITFPHIAGEYKTPEAEWKIHCQRLTPVPE